MTDILDEKQKNYNEQFKSVASKNYNFFSLSKPKIKSLLDLPPVNIEAHINGFIEHNSWPSFTVCAQQCVKWCYAH